MACADRLRSGAKIVLVLALGGAAAFAYRSDRLLFELPAVKTQLYADKTSQALARRHGLRAGGLAPHTRARARVFYSRRKCRTQAPLTKRRGYDT